MNCIISYFSSSEKCLVLAVDEFTFTPCFHKPEYIIRTINTIQIMLDNKSNFISSSQCQHYWPLTPNLETIFVL